MNSTVGFTQAKTDNGFGTAACFLREKKEPRAENKSITYLDSRYQKGQDEALRIKSKIKYRMPVL